MKNCKMKN